MAELILLCAAGVWRNLRCCNSSPHCTANKQTTNYYSTLQNQQNANLPMRCFHWKKTLYIQRCSSLSQDDWREMPQSSGSWCTSATGPSPSPSSLPFSLPLSNSRTDTVCFTLPFRTTLSASQSVLIFFFFNSTYHCGRCKLYFLKTVWISQIVACVRNPLQKVVDINPNPKPKVYK